MASFADDQNSAFEITSKMVEAVLIQGEITCVLTREKFTGPFVLPRNKRLFRYFQMRYLKYSSKICALNFEFVAVTCHSDSVLKLLTE